MFRNQMLVSACGSFWSESPRSKCSVTGIPLYLFEEDRNKMISQKLYISNYKTEFSTFSSRSDALNKK